MKNYKIQVITKVPDIDDDGNLCDDTFIGLWNEGNDEFYFRAYEYTDEYRHHIKINVKLPVFTLGEIIIVDDNLREVGGIYRKADKWFVSYKLFNLDDMKRAVNLSIKIYNKKNNTNRNLVN